MRARRQFRVKQDQRRYPDRAGADGSDRDQYAKHGADDDRDDADLPLRHCAKPCGIARDDGFPENQRSGGDEQGDRQHRRDHLPHHRAINADMAERQNRDNGHRHAACRQTPHDTPIDTAVETMHRAAGGFRHRGIKKIGADGRRRVNAEQQNKQRRHQRTAANAGQSDQHTDAKPGRGIERLQHMQCAHRADLSLRYAFQSRGHACVRGCRADIGDVSLTTTRCRASRSDRESTVF